MSLFTIYYSYLLLLKYIPSRSGVSARPNEEWEQ